MRSPKSTLVDTVLGMNMGKRIEARLTELGWGQRDLLERVYGLEKGTLSALVVRDSKRSEWSERIAAALGVTHAWLTLGKPPKEPPGAPSVSLEQSSTVPELETVHLESAGNPRTIQRVPVVGTARMGDDGYYEELGHPAGFGDGWIDSYSSDGNAYALRVKGDSMHPSIRHGQFVVIEPNSACVPGEYIVLALRDGRKMVKELVRESESEIVIESVNGNGRATLDKVDIERMQPVAAIIPASRWRPA